MAELKPCSPLAHWIGHFTMWITGWKVIDQYPTHQKMIIIAAPHTTNWDLLYLLSAAYVLRVRINWLAKKSLFFPGGGAILRFLGGVPVDRSKSNNMVQMLADQIRNSDQIAIVIPPEGTRGYTDYWKSGFYRIAQAADIPVVCGYLDYEKKEAGLGLSVNLTGHVVKDMNTFRGFYEDIKGKHPDKSGPIRLRDEEPDLKNAS